MCYERKMDERMRTCACSWLAGWMFVWMRGKMNAQVDKCEDGWMGWWLALDGWMRGRTDWRMYWVIDRLSVALCAYTLVFEFSPHMWDYVKTHNCRTEWNGLG